MILISNLSTLAEIGKMKKLLLLFCFIFFSFHSSFSQSSEIKRANHWYFGWNAGLDFSNDTVVAVTDGAYNNYEATATISDTAGNLLFYTDAETIWNRNHQIMQNGDYIGGCWSSTQGALIVPEPENDSIYYIFTTDCAEYNLVRGLRYSIVNMNLDSGRGAIVQKDILLHTPVAEKIAGIHHANGKDVWVVTHEWNSDKFFAYLVTGQGVDTVPVISSIGSVHSGGTQNGNSNGYMKFSPNGKNLVSIISPYSLVELFDFNDTTALVSNPLILSYGGNMLTYGASFSPDNTKLYVSYPCDLQVVTIGGKLYQFNLLAGSPSDIIASKTLIYSSTNYHFFAMQIGIDGKIYLSEDEIQLNDGGILGVINNPNRLGFYCNFVQNGMFLSGKRGRLGLPNFVESYFNCDTCVVDTTGVSVSGQLFSTIKIFIFPNPAIDELYIQSSDEILSLGIKNLQGISFYKDDFIHPEKNLRINVSSLPNGLYMIYINTEYRNYIRKLIKIKNFN